MLLVCVDVVCFCVCSMSFIVFDYVACFFMVLLMFYGFAFFKMFSDDV